MKFELNSFRESVRGSADLERVLRVPRRLPRDLAPGSRTDALVELMSARLRRPDRPLGAPCGCRALGRHYCIDRLLPIQALALYEAGIAGGLLAPIKVGGGKCLSSSAEYFDVAAGMRRSVGEQHDEVVVPSLFENINKLGVAKASAFPSGKKECVRVLLRDGASVDASTDHKILTQRGWIEAASLLTSDYVAVPTRLPDPLSETKATDDEISLLALMESDGGVSQRQAKFSNMLPAVIAEFQKTATSVCSGWSESKQVSRAREFNLRGGRCGENTATAFRDKWNLHGLSKNKRLHPSIWGLPRRQVALFLNRFWACDGHVNHARGLFECGLASELLLDDIRALLLRLGVRSRKRARLSTCRTGTFKSWTLTIRGADAVRFFEEVGPVLGKEKESTRAYEMLMSRPRNTNTDVVPLRGTAATIMFDELGWPGNSPERLRHKGMRELGACSRQNISRERFVAFCKKHKYAGRFAHFAADGVAWERVKSVTPIGIQPVFDLCVSETSNFVAGNMVVHNTVLDILMAMVIEDCRVAVLLLPPGLLGQLRAEYDAVAEHFRVPSLIMPGARAGAVVPGAPRLHVVPYSKFSRGGATALLDELKPDLIIVDEAHNLKNRAAVRTGRVLRRFAEAPETRMCAWSGSMASRTIMDFAHLSAFSLGENSPLPLDPDEVEKWAAAVDPSDWPAPAGALKRLCRPGESLHDAVARRLLETRGVVVTQGGEWPATIVLRERVPPKMPKKLADMIGDLRATWTRPDGEEFVEALEVAQCARQLACGFYYRWRFPDAPPRDLVEEWFAARKAWNRELRDKLKRPQPHLDSPGLLTEAAIRAYDGYVGDLPVWSADAWPRWRDVAEKVRHVTEAVWVDDYLARDAAEWARSTRGIVWYDLQAFGARVAEFADIPLHGGGPGAEARILAERGDRSIAASTRSHGTGRDGLQHVFAEQLVANPSPSGDWWEQLFGRLNRVGQKADEVVSHVYRHTPEMADAIDRAVRLAKFVEGLLTNKQMLLAADVEWDLLRK